MNVSESLDWQHLSIDKLADHRFIGLTKTGATLDSHLNHTLKGLLTDSDGFVAVFWEEHDGRMKLNTQDFKAINVLEETR